MIKVQSFRNHLCTYQYIRFPLLKIRNDTFISRTGTGGIQIHTGNSGFGKQNLDIIFYLLCTKPTIAQVSTFASRALMGQLIGITAVMASQLIQSFVKCQTHITVFALRHPPARITLNHRSKATPVLKQDDLLLLIQSLMNILKQQRREWSVHTLLAMQLMDIHGDNFR